MHFDELTLDEFRLTPEQLAQVSNHAHMTAQQLEALQEAMVDFARYSMTYMGIHRNHIQGTWRKRPQRTLNCLVQ